MNTTNHQGFTLIELMITVAIVGILAAIAIPSYQGFIIRARFSEIVNAAAPYKLAVGECVHSLNTVTGCTGGTNGIPADLTVAEGGVASIRVANGQITLVPVQQNGILTADSLVLSPTVGASNRVIWAATGGAVTKGYVKQ